jgi:hypothetical protein
MALPATVQEELIKEQTLNDPAVIDLLGLSVSFGGRPILKGLRGDLRGKAIGLLGPNGAGKTTLIHTLLGFYAPTAGTAHIFGHDIVGQEKEIKSLVGYMPERDSFIAQMSAVHFVRLMAELSGLPSEAALERAQQYVEAGADMIFAEALRTVDDYRQFTAAVKAPILANLTEFGQTPYFTVAELHAAGIAMVLYPLSASRAAAAASLEVYRAIRHDGTQRNAVGTMQTRSELYDVLGYRA